MKLCDPENYLCISRNMCFELHKICRLNIVVFWLIHTHTHTHTHTYIYIKLAYQNGMSHIKSTLLRMMKWPFTMMAQSCSLKTQSKCQTLNLNTNHYMYKLYKFTLNGFTFFFITSGVKNKTVSQNLKNWR